MSKEGEYIEAIRRVSGVKLDKINGAKSNSNTETDIITAIRRASSTHEDITSIELTRRISGFLIIYHFKNYLYFYYNNYICIYIISYLS